MNVLKQVKPLSEERELELLKDAVSYTYSSADNYSLNAHFFFPNNHQATDKKPVILFFHGGLWDVRMNTQFAAHCMHFASRGMVAVAIEYRVSSLNESTPEDSLEDADLALEWLQNNHANLGINPDQVIFAGAASGAYLAFSLAMRSIDKKVVAETIKPVGVIGLSSIVNTTKKGNEYHSFKDPKVAHKQSPSNKVKKGLPPSLLIHGKSDTIIPHEHVAKFAKMLKRKKNQCEFVEFEAVNHSFFNFNVSARHFEITLNSMDAFAVKLGLIEAIDYT